MDRPRHAHDATTSDDPTGACLDENLLAAFAEERLDAPREAKVQAHVAVCDECRALALALHPGLASVSAGGGRIDVGRGEAGPSLVFRRPSRTVWMGGLVAAAAVLVALAWALRTEPGADPAPGAARGERLLAAVTRARALQADVPSDFTPYTPERLAASAAPEALRGGLALVRPAGLVLSARPTVEWLPVAGVVSYTVKVYAAADAGHVLWERHVAGISVEWPLDAAPLADGALVEVTAAAPLGRVEGRRWVALAADANAFHAQAQSLAAAAPDEALLLRAHLALHRGLLEEAERCAALDLKTRPTDELSRLTLAHVRRRLGVPEVVAAVAPR